ncbi:UNVERIFIED_CONTAM: hypothetical protein FKN15_023106 [Acipenser sinensis]
MARSRWEARTSEITQQNCCGAGTAADTEMTTQIISSNLELHALSTGRPSRVATANRMLKQMLFRYQGYIGAALVLGGVDSAGPHLYSIYPHGSTDKLPYVTMGKWQSKCIIIALYNTAVYV